MSNNTIGENLRLAIDRFQYENEQDEPRTHLGASVIGSECPRYVWYSFRWFVLEKHIARMLRLFKRGHGEENKFIELLGKVGAVVEAVDPATGKQWLFSDLGGHFGGSCDGKVSNLDAFGLPGVGLFESKTHGEKSFAVLTKKGLLSAKPSHYVQMQLYMGYFGLPWGLYCAVNKNTDETHFEVIPYRDEIARMYSDRAAEIINVKTPPKRISEKSTFFVCKMCPAHEICHHRADHTPPKNCRTCLNSVANTATGEWDCLIHGPGIPKSFQMKGCDQWTPLA